MTDTITRGRVVHFAEAFAREQPAEGEEVQVEGWSAIVTDVRTETRELPAADVEEGEEAPPPETEEVEVVDLTVFYPGHAGIPVVGIPRDDSGEAPGTWRFPPRA